METIRNYLENMFAGLPNTPEVLKAKDELGQMMEDKYAELIAEGKAENEAIGIVISEFGNLDELAETLGLAHVMGEEQAENGRNVTREDVQEYLKCSAESGFLTGLGVFLCITCAVGCMLASVSPFPGIGENAAMAIGVTMLFAFLAVAVGLFIFGSVKMNEWSFLKEERCSIDYATSEYVRNEQNNFRTGSALMMTIGVILIIISVVPVSVLGIMAVDDEGFVMIAAAALMLIFIGIGVMLIIIASTKSESYKRLMGLNRQGTVAGSRDHSKIHYETKAVETIMEVYQPTVTCLYLIWSFITFDWYITWIIFPVAAIVRKVIEVNFGKENRG
ncbi:MAG: permease prefix domain 1-containing protein [Butyrivibrio sp.]|jgi:uncharacterized membrane protein YqjE|nr:permease prefix domain 1-containing protein [Butyrivibrio sp.]